IFWTALFERQGGLEFSWAAKPETDTFDHEPALVARTCSPAKLLGFPKFVGTPRCSDARRCHPCAWRNQGLLAAMAERRTSKQPRGVAICTDRQLKRNGPSFDHLVGAGEQGLRLAVSYRALFSANTPTSVRFSGDTNRTRSGVTA